MVMVLWMTSRPPCHIMRTTAALGASVIMEMNEDIMSAEGEARGEYNVQDFLVKAKVHVPSLRASRYAACTLREKRSTFTISAAKDFTVSSVDVSST